MKEQIRMKKNDSLQFVNSLTSENLYCVKQLIILKEKKKGFNKYFNGLQCSHPYLSPSKNIQN